MEHWTMNRAHEWKNHSQFTRVGYKFQIIWLLNHYAQHHKNTWFPDSAQTKRLHNFPSVPLVAAVQLVYLYPIFVTFWFKGIIYRIKAIQPQVTLKANNSKKTASTFGICHRIFTQLYGFVGVCARERHHEPWRQLRRNTIILSLTPFRFFSLLPRQRETEKLK